MKADEILPAGVRQGYVQWAPTREELERQVGPLRFAKIAVIVKGERVRLIRDMRRNGTNSKVQLQKRLVLPMLKDIVDGVMKLMANKSNEEGIEFHTLDFRASWNLRSAS